MKVASIEFGIKKGSLILQFLDQDGMVGGLMVYEPKTSKRAMRDTGEDERDVRNLALYAFQGIGRSIDRFISISNSRKRG